MDLKTIQLIIDFGFTVLIWAVQLVIYPSFGYYNRENLLKWHHIYTIRVTYIVLPLMLTQLLISITNVFNAASFVSVISLIIVLTLWLLTFLVFVPLHQKIDADLANKTDLIKLVSKNRYRTFLWSLLFLLSLINFVYYH